MVMKIEDIKNSNMSHDGKAVEYLRNIKQEIIGAEILHGGYNPCIVDDMIDILELVREEFGLARLEDYNLR